MSGPHVNGIVEVGFEGIADAFTDNFLERGDTGAACTVYQHGVPVVDIWAGETPSGAFTHDTKCILYSVSKGITTICLLMAVEEGALRLDEPVARYWPEFAAHGKGDVTVRELLAHRAGLTAPERPHTAADVIAWTPIVDDLAARAPEWEPGTAFEYHPVTFGFLAGEILRRTTGLRPNEWLRDRIAPRLGVSISFGADPDDPDFTHLGEVLPSTQEIPVDPKMLERMYQRADGTLGLNGAFDGRRLFDAGKSREFLTAELAGANVVARAHDLARLYAATVGEVDGVRLLSAETVEDARRPISQGPMVSGYDDGNAWGTGFMVCSAKRRMAGPGSFGHDGAGGHIAFGQLEDQIGFAYQTIRPGGVPDDRAEALSAALRATL